MGTTIKDEVGVEMAGPDEPGLAAAKARDVGGEAYLRYTDECRANDRHPLNFEDWASRRQPGNGVPVENLGLTARQIEKRDMARQQASGVREQAIQRGLMSGSAGAVSREQAGILPTGGITVSDDMVHRAMNELVRHANPLGASAVRATLEAALHG